MRFIWRCGSTPTRFLRRCLRAYTQIEIDALAQGNPSGVATKSQRQEAKETAQKRAEAEAADGRFRRLSQCPVLWDGRTNTLYAGSTSSSVLERLQALFRETFDRDARADHSRQHRPGPFRRSERGRRPACGELRERPILDRRQRGESGFDPGLVGRRPDRPRLPGQRVHGLDLALASGFRRYDQACRRLGGQPGTGEDAVARLPAR